MIRHLQLSIAGAGAGGTPLASDIPMVAADDIGRHSTHEEIIWYVESASLRDALRQLAELRSTPQARRYLQPVVLVVPEGTSDVFLEALGDAITTRQCLREERDLLEQSLGSIHRWLRYLPDEEEEADQLSVRLLRHMASRSLTAAPLATADFPSGYVYPALMPYFDGESEGVFETLDFLNEQGFVNGEFVARVHSCYHCSSSFLNFEEVCTQCNSADLELLELVHHFRCGHVAPLSEFQSGSQLHCPKCDRDLHHIGVDYDKPSVIHSCNSCGHRMQDPEVISTCFRCGRRASPDNQNHRTVARFSLTPIGENGARHGIASLFRSILDREVGLVPWPVFDKLVFLELSRMERFDRFKSSIMMVGFEGIEHVYRELGARAAQVFEALSHEFSQVLRATDVVSNRNDGLYLVLLTETASNDGEHPRARLLERLKLVLDSNLESPPTVTARLVPVNGDLDLERELDSMLASDA